MKILHISFHKGCINDINYIFNKIPNIEVEVLSSIDGCTSRKDIDPIREENAQHYNMTEKRANQYWNKYNNYFQTFDCIITSDTAPISRIFIQNGWNKPLIIWICNRFDYGHRTPGVIFPDKSYYDLFKNASNMENVKMIGYTCFENIYCKLRGIDIGNLVIPPSGGISNIYNDLCIQDDKNNDVVFVPPYNNDTKMMNLCQKIQDLGFRCYCGKYNGPVDLTNYKCVVHIPYAWSNLAFFEMFTLGIVYFIPSLHFFFQIMKQRFYWSPPFLPYYLYKSEWYNDRYSDLLIYFDSWEDLSNKIKNTDYISLKNKLKDFGKDHINHTLDSWSDILENLSDKL